MDNYREIVTKAVIYKSKKNILDKVSLNTETQPSTILGCWIINNHFNGNINNNNINIIGSYDINVWYSYDNDTKTAVYKETYDYVEDLSVNTNENIKDKEVIIRSLKQPTVKNVKLNGNTIELEIEKEMAAEVVGDAKIKVPTESIEDDYIDVTNSKNISEIDKINENYIN